MSHQPQSTTRLSRSVGMVWFVGVAMIVLLCIVLPAAVQLVFWFCLGLTVFKLAKYAIRTSALQPELMSDTCQRCDSLLYRTQDKRWLDFENKAACWGRLHQPLSEISTSGAR